MSTRSNIRIQSGNRKFQIYRHWDGYPEGVVPDLQEFFAWNKGRNDDLSYTIANFFYFFKRSAEENEVEQRKEDKRIEEFTGPSWKNPTHLSGILTGYGIVEAQDPEPETWIEWFYVADLDERTITCYEVGRTDPLVCEHAELVFYSKHPLVAPEKRLLANGIAVVGNKIFEVPSKTTPGQTYTVTLEPAHCTCAGFKYRKTCSHLKAAIAASGEAMAQ